MPDLEPLLRARSIAIVGASAKEDSFGWHVVRQLLDFGYQGQIIPINPGYDQIEGLACYPTIDAAPGPIDCAAICVADERIEAALLDAVNAGLRAAVIFGVAAGFASDGSRLRDRITLIAREADLALIGASCMGFFNFTDRLFLTGYPYHREPLAGTISFITHSGSTLSAIAKNTRGMNFNYVISPGQELVLTAADYLDFVVKQPQTNVVGLFLEAIRDPERFLGALEQAQERDVPVVLLKVGRTELGARMALAHTGALAGAHVAIEAVANRYGVALVRTIEELLDTLELFAAGRRAVRGTLGAITDSGGERGMLVDLAVDAGVPFGQLSPTTIRTLEANLDPGLEPGNPADLWGSGKDWQRVYRTCIGAMLADDAVGAFNFGIDFNIGSRLGPDYRAIAIDAFNSTTKPFAVVANVAAGINPDDAVVLRGAGVPVLLGAESGLLAFRHLFARIACGSEMAGLRNADEPRFSPEAADMLALRRPLTEQESLTVLADIGLQAVRFMLARHELRAIDAARTIGYPVVLKTAAIGVLHKSDRGGVQTGLRTDDEVREAYGQMLQRFGPDVIIQQQMDTTRGVELFLGMSVDAQFGPLVTIGLGGIWIETLRDTITFLAPCTAREVCRRLPLLHGFELLNGARGRDRVDVAALAQLVEQFSRAAAALPSLVAEIDINPLLAVGDQFTMLDALIVPVPAMRAEPGTG